MCKLKDYRYFPQLSIEIVATSLDGLRYQKSKQTSKQKDQLGSSVLSSIQIISFKAFPTNPLKKPQTKPTKPKPTKKKTPHTLIFGLLIIVFIFLLQMTKNRKKSYG